MTFHDKEFTHGLFDTTNAFQTMPQSNRIILAIDDDESEDETGGPETAAASAGKVRGHNYVLTGERALARGWPARARDNIAAIRLAAELESAIRAPTAEEQGRLLRFIGFGATDLAQNCFRRPGVQEFQPGWEAIGAALEAAVTGEEYAALQRATQYAHYTPEWIIRSLWQAALRLGFDGGKVLEPGMGTGLFFALLPESLRSRCRLTGVEYDPVTARIARLIHPEAEVRCEDYTRSRLGGGFDLVIGNPPFAARIVRADPETKALALTLHDYFIARSIARLRPGGLALFVTSTGTMDKIDPSARAHIHGLADLLGAVRLPAGSMRADAGTNVVVDVLAFRRRLEDEAPGGHDWLALAPVDAAIAEDADASVTLEVNRYFAEHPEMVLGAHTLARGIYTPELAYTCRPHRDGRDVQARLVEALEGLPCGVFTPGAVSDAAEDDAGPAVAFGTAATGATIKEGSYLIADDGRLMQIMGGATRVVTIKLRRGDDGIAKRDADIIRGLIPVRDALRATLRAQMSDQPWQEAWVSLRIAYGNFVRRFGAINHTVIVVTTDPESGDERESHRRPNLAPFADDPDCWLVASIETYDLDSDLARMGPVFRERVIAPPTVPVLATAADALALTLNDLGRVDLDYLAGLIDGDPETVLAELGDAVFRNPETDTWETADAYLSGPVRRKLAVAEAAAGLDPAYQRNVTALQQVQPQDLRPSDIDARLGAPWIPTEYIEAFAADVLTVATTVRHTVEIALWSIDVSPFAGTAAGTSIWGTSRRHAGLLLHDALNSSTPQIFDTIYEDGVEKRVFNAEATEAAKEKLGRIKQAFIAWVWTDADRADRLVRIYNDRFNNLVPRRFDGRHLTLPGASDIITLYPHQKRVIWRIVVSGTTYIAHTVGAGKSYAIAGAIMEQRRLGLIEKPMLVVPGHCLAQVAREFLQLYPNARILVADDTNFVKARRASFLARAATATWDAIIITHAAFRFIPVPAAFEREMIQDQLDAFIALKENVDADDRLTRKRLEALKERLEEKLGALRGCRDDMVTLAEIGIDQIIVDEAHEFRKLTFATNQINLKGVDPDGSQRAWDLYVKARFLEQKQPGRALIQASGTPIVNTLGEMWTLLRFQCPEALFERGVHEFDAWAAVFGDTATELELQPSGAYKPVTRFATFINLAELGVMFRSVADVVQKADLRELIRLPRIQGGHRQIVTAPSSPAFRAYQRYLAQRLKAIEARKGKVEKGDDIQLAVITDGRHAAIDMRLVQPCSENEPANKLNELIARVYRIWEETADHTYIRPDGSPYPLPGAGQLIFSDLGTLSVEANRGFSAYRWMKQSLIALGVPAEQIAFMQDYKKAADKQRIFAAFREGRVRVLIGSSNTMGTGTNVQLRLKALHHLDVPWLPSQIEQREGRIERQGNQYNEIEIYAYATLGSMDATMWQKNERNARFIDAALAGDPTLRRIDDADSQASQYALAKAIASGDGRMMQKAGLETEVARLERQQAAHFDDQHAVRRAIQDARYEIDRASKRIADITQDLAQRRPTRGEAFALDIDGRCIMQRKAAGELVLASLTPRARAGRSSWPVGRIGGFDLKAELHRLGRGTLPLVMLVLQRCNFAQRIEVEADLTPLGLIARLEHTLDHFEVEIDREQRSAAEAGRRLTEYAPRLGAPFALQLDLEDKRAQLKAIEDDLAAAKPAHEQDEDQAQQEE